MQILNLALLLCILFRAIDYDSTSWSLVGDGQWDVNGLVYRKILWECLGIMFSYLQISWS